MLCVFPTVYRQKCALRLRQNLANGRLRTNEYGFDLLLEKVGTATVEEKPVKVKYLRFSTTGLSTTLQGMFAKTSSSFRNAIFCCEAAKQKLPTLEETFFPYFSRCPRFHEGTASIGRAEGTSTERSFQCKNRKDQRWIN